ncbi:LysE family translocator [Blastococcus sp. TF02A-26]|uniref:LysE family translocator n=1 Tax=Blastococcus sp. TF02A-26 TaxID=2250577 RepID=UPI000DE983CA|nr:LysE family translocator [Blastococcus sp. TF02A-26]RBY84722.1 LysE family translocator [Blastococcus sp. TF02A-26]
MDLLGTLPAFLPAVLLIAASPGPAMALIVRRAALRGLPGAVPTVLGVEAGLFVWALLAGAGLAALVAASEVAYLVLRVAGAGVLLYLGGRALLGVWRERRSGVAAAALPEVGERGRLRWWPAFGEGLVVQLANPKLAVFVIAFYPQFVPASDSPFAATVVLATVQVTVEVGLYLALAAGVARAGEWFRRPRIRRRLEAVSGTVLVVLGLRVATTAR